MDSSTHSTIIHSLSNRPSTDSSPGPRDDCAESGVVQFSIDTVLEGISKTQWKKKLKHQKKLKKWEKMK